MYNNQQILCVIPARGGSKRLPGKNIKPFLGKPLIARAIEAAKGSAYVDMVAVSTDDETIAAVAREYGARVVMRPAELATDDAPVAPAIAHAGEALEAEKQTDLVVLVQPTVPGVLSSDIDSAIEKLVESGARSCISVCDITDRPEFMYRMDAHGKISLYSSTPAARTQDMEPLCRVNGAVYVSRRAVVMEEGKVIDNTDCVAVMMPRERSIDIDTEADFTLAETLLSVKD